MNPRDLPQQDQTHTSQTSPDPTILALQGHMTPLHHADVERGCTTFTLIPPLCLFT